MRGVAVAANIIQMLIILILFLLQGIALAGSTIFALFLLLVVAFVNLLVLFFHPALAVADKSSLRSEKTGIVKRKDLRIKYPTEARPELAVDTRCFSVMDLSENGIRISIDPREPLKRRFRGTLTLLSKIQLDVQVSKVRRQGSEAALLIKTPIDWDTLSSEKELATGALPPRPR